MLSKVQITKLFGKELVNIDFSKRSVIITGDNGNGKTTILNTIYKSLTGNYSVSDLKYNIIKIKFDSDFKYMKCIFVKKSSDENGEKIKIKYVSENQSLIVNLRVSKMKKIIILEKIVKKQNSISNTLFEEKGPENQLIPSGQEVSIVNLMDLIDEDDDFSKKLKEINKSLLYFPTYRRIDLDIESYYSSLYDSPIMALLQREQREKKKKFGISDRRVIGMSNSDIEEILKEYSRTLNEVSSNSLDILFRDFTKSTMMKMGQSLGNIRLSSFTKNIKTLEQLKSINDILELNISTDTLQEISSQYEKNIQLLDEIRSNDNNVNAEDRDRLFEAVLALPLMQVIQDLQTEYSKYNNKITEELTSYNYISENLKDFSGNKLKLIKTELNEFEFQKVGTQINKFSDFSTGEKQLITFLVYSAIELPKTTPALVIIDEPELSLHVKWQNKLLKNLLKKSNLQVLSATHSPYIINRSVDSLVVRKV
ncbi:AAA family ATPase [Streptococcus salivarius]